MAVADPLLDDAAPREHAHQRGRREVRHVLGREVERARGLERAVEARHLERDDGLDVRARGGERQLLEEAERVRQVLHHVPGDDEVGRDLRQRARRDEALAPQLHLRVRRLGDAMRIEADVPAGRPRLGERCKEFGVAVADLDDDRARGQARERLVTERAHVLAPSRRAAERAARLPGVLTGGRDRRHVEDMPAIDAADRVDARAVDVAVEERDRDVMGADRAGHRPHQIRRLVETLHAWGEASAACKPGTRAGSSGRVGREPSGRVAPRVARRHDACQPGTLCLVAPVFAGLR